MCIDCKKGTMCIDYKTETMSCRIGCTDRVRLNTQKNHNPTKTWRQEAHSRGMTPKHKNQNQRQTRRPSLG